MKCSIKATASIAMLSFLLVASTVKADPRVGSGSAEALRSGIRYPMISTDQVGRSLTLESSANFTPMFFALKDLSKSKDFSVNEQGVCVSKKAKKSTVYCSVNKLNIRVAPDTVSDIIGQYVYRDKIKLVAKLGDWGLTNKGWVSLNYVSKTMPVEIVDKVTQDAKEDSALQERIQSGDCLTKRGGTYYGPSGKETYYNLPMEGVVQIMRNMGNNDRYWVRADGCKMLGQYVMVACNLNEHPRGSIIRTSRGKAIVCDTGSFTTNGSGVKVDVAVIW